MVSACYRAKLGFSSKKGFPKMIKVVVLLKVWWSLPEIKCSNTIFSMFKKHKCLDLQINIRIHLKYTVWINEEDKLVIFKAEVFLETL